MPIICLEGASAVGKTTTCTTIANIGNTYVVPEVNLLFERPKNMSKTWYLERQVERWKIAKRKLCEYDFVILDGDIFQPLCYNWCFHFEIFNQSLTFLHEFYESEIKVGNILFPDKYFYLHTSTDNIRSRKENDQTRQRGNFEKHIRIIEPHQRYYEVLNQFVPHIVQLVEASNMEHNVKVIMDNVPLEPLCKDSEGLLNHITDWLTNSKA
ncbi:chloramphenicol acetyltransferase [Priestia taiwanensis]|uniref:Chloramphenicol acetyltransferase n=1 Tax=Priestia taiwanensis TaxID=1347902 RepID=A0A917ALS2_9BACI|nr:chloramphenicol acetyltransferase [Priestia taiwanensis]MBM7362102.1 thymidylate kinase [Priestia taiwanensis]GGE59472.1 chloramphenicol acetyltransferase [Priestia taiwanensis]